MKNTLKIVKNISERQAFENCLKILESFELQNKQFAFTENYIKWLLNKFDMPFVYLEALEDVPPDEKPKNAAAFAQSENDLISVPVNDLNLENLYSHLGYIAHELKHVSDTNFYINGLLLGANREYFSEPFTDSTWKNANVKQIIDESLLHSIAYYLNPHEIGARENEWFYTNLFLRLANNYTNNPFLKNVLQSQLKKCISTSQNIDDNMECLYNYQNCPMHKLFLKKINKEILNLFKILVKIKDGDIKKYIEVKDRLFALITLYPDEKLAKNIAKYLSKKTSGPFSLAIQSDSLQLLSTMPFNMATEKEINYFLTQRTKLTEYLIKSIEPVALAQRFLLLNGSKSLYVSTSEFTNGYKIEKNIKIIRAIEKEFEKFNIVGINNLPNSKAKKQALKKFINTKNFNLTTDVLEEYNNLLGGKLCLNCSKQHKQYLNEEKIK